MNKKRFLAILMSVSLMGPFFSSVEVSASSDRLDELHKQEQELNKQSNDVGNKINDREQKMQALEVEKAQLEEDVAGLQSNIDELVTEISGQEEEIVRIENEIKRLQEEIEQLEIKIEKRNEKLEIQARSVQKNANSTDIIQMLLSAESLSDLIGKIGVVNQLISANQSVVEAQLVDQKALEDNEVQVQMEQKEVERVKAELEMSRNNLVNQRNELDAKIIQVAEQFDMTVEERDSFINEQNLIAQRTSSLNKEMQAEQERIVEDQKRKEIAQAKITQVEGNSKEEFNAPESKESSSKPVTISSSNKTSSGWIRPAQGKLTSPFGWRTHPVYGDRRFHKAVDIAGSGSIVASRSGKVTVASYNNGLGYFVKIDHGDGFASVYSHMQPNLSVSVGQQVSQGQQIGIMGTTGTSTGVHLDFQILKNGVNVNPAPYIGL